MVAGIRFENFSSAALQINAAATTDKARAVYWLPDAASTSNNAVMQLYAGIAIDAMTSWTAQNVYCLNTPSAGNAQIQLNNFRAAMTSIVSGRDQGGTFQYNTGTQAVTGNISQTHNFVLCTPGSGGGPRNGVKSVFWTTATRIYSAIVSNITNGTVYFESGSSPEAPPGTTTTYAATGALASIAYDSLMDRFLVFSTAASGTRHYCTQYREDTGQWDRIILADTKQTNQSTEDSTAAIVPTTVAAAPLAVCLNGMTYLMTTGTTAITNWLFNIPFAADWEYAGYGAYPETSNCCVVTPAMSTSQFASFVAGYFNEVAVIGGPTNPVLGRTATNLGTEPGAVRLYYRTNVGSSGSSDNGGTWQLLDYSGLMSNIAASSQVQARLEFRVLNSAFPSRVTRVCFEGTGSASITNFQFSQKNTSLSNKQFAFRQAVAFGANTTLYIRIYDAVLNSLLVTDTTSSPTGVWQYSTNGGTSWSVFGSQGTGATVTFTVSGSSLSAITTTPVSGGSGYPASATVILLVSGGGGSNGLISATTNSSGVITAFSATPVAVGTGYTGATGATTSSSVPWSTVWDYTNTTTYLMYTPASIADNIDALPVISLS